MCVYTNIHMFTKASICVGMSICVHMCVLYASSIVLDWLGVVEGAVRRPGADVLVLGDEAAAAELAHARQQRRGGQRRARAAAAALLVRQPRRHRARRPSAARCATHNNTRLTHTHRQPSVYLTNNENQLKLLLSRFSICGNRFQKLVAKRWKKKQPRFVRTLVSPSNCTAPSYTQYTIN